MKNLIRNEMVVKAIVLTQRILLVLSTITMFYCVFTHERILLAVEVLEAPFIAIPVVLVVRALYCRMSTYTLIPSAMMLVCVLLYNLSDIRIYKSPICRCCDRYLISPDTVDVIVTLIFILASICYIINGYTAFKKAI